MTKLDLCGFTGMSHRQLSQAAVQMSSVKWVSNRLATDNHRDNPSGFKWLELDGELNDRNRRPFPSLALFNIFIFSGKPITFHSLGMPHITTLSSRKGKEKLAWFSCRSPASDRSILLCLRYKGDLVSTRLCPVIQKVNPQKNENYNTVRVQGLDCKTEQLLTLGPWC